MTLLLPQQKSILALGATIAMVFAFMASPAAAQRAMGPTAMGGGGGGGGGAPGEGTIAVMEAIVGPATGQLFQVNDNPSGDCSTASTTGYTLCMWNGSSWTSAGVAGGGDNLGNATATDQGAGEGLDLAGFYVSNTDTLFFDEQVSADTATAGHGGFWVRTETPNVAMFTDDAGNDYDISGDEIFYVANYGTGLAAINAAISACETAEGGTVMLPRGETIIDSDPETSPLITLAGVDNGAGTFVGVCTLTGYGTGAPINNSGGTGVGGSELKFTNHDLMTETDGRRVIIEAQADGQEIRDFAIRNSASVATDLTMPVLFMNSAKYFRLNNLSLRTPGTTNGIGIELEDSQKSSIIQVHVDDYDQGLRLSSSALPGSTNNAVTIEASIFRSGDTGIFIEGPTCVDIYDGAGTPQTNDGTPVADGLCDIDRQSLRSNSGCASGIVIQGGVIEGNDIGLEFDTDSYCTASIYGTHFEQNTTGINIQINSPSAAFHMYGGSLQGIAETHTGYSIERTVAQSDVDDSGDTNGPDTLHGVEFFGDMNITAGEVYAIDSVRRESTSDLSGLTLVTTGEVLTADITDVTVTATELEELATLEATTISANQWAALGGIAETLTSGELDLLDGITVLSGDNTGDETLSTSSTGLDVSDHVIDLDIAPSSGSATLIEEEDALQVKYDSADFTESASGLGINAGAIDEPMLNSTNAPTDDYILSYNLAGTNFTWIENTGGGGDAATLDTLDSTEFAILAGQAGGQTIIGGTGSGDDLSFSTTANVTKGNYIFAEDVSGTLISCDTDSEKLEIDASGFLTCGTIPGGGFDSTTVNDTTWGDNTEASMAWTMDPTGVSGPVLNFADDSIIITNAATFTVDTNTVLTDASTVSALTTVGALDSGSLAAGFTVIGEDFLAASLAFDDGDVLDFSGLTMNSATEGLILPQIASACVAMTGEGQVCWDVTGEDLYVGNGSIAVQMNTGSGTVTSSGPPSVDEIAVFTSGTDIEGDPALTFDTSTDTLAGPLVLTFGTGTGTINALDAVDATTEDTIEALIFDSDIETVAGNRTFTGTVDLPNNTVSTSDITNSNVTEDKLAASLAFDDGDALNFSGLTMNSATEGIILPQIASACVAMTGQGQVCWDTAGEDLYVGNGSIAVQMNSAGGTTDVGDCTGSACFTSGSPDAALTFDNATSGTITLQAVTGALGTVTLSMPAETGTILTNASNVTAGNLTAGEATVVTTASSADATSAIAFVETEGAGSQGVKTDPGITYDATANDLTVVGDITAATITATSSLASGSTTTPNVTLTDSDVSGQGRIIVEDFTNPDAVMSLQVDETGTLVTYIDLDGVNDMVEILDVWDFQEDGVLVHTATINDDVCDTAGEWWYDTTDTAFEFCEAASGAPATLGGGGTTAISGLDNAGADDTLANAEFELTWQWDTATTATAMDALTIELTNDATTDAVSQGGFVVEQADGGNDAAGTTEYLVRLSNLETTATDLIDDAILIQATTAAGITDAIDASDAEIDNALRVGANNIVFDTAETLSHDGTDFVFSDTISAPSISSGADATPTITFDDSTTTVETADATIVVNCPTGVAANEDCDMAFNTQVDSLQTEAFRIDVADAGIQTVRFDTAALVADGALTIGALDTFGVSDTTPDVSAGSHFITNATHASITDFDAGAGTLEVGHIITVEQATATTFDCTASGLQCGSTDIVTATGDFTTWSYDGTDWHLISYMDVSTDLGTDAGGGGGATTAGTIVTYVNDIADDFGLGATSETPGDYSIYLDEAVASITLAGSGPALTSTTTLAVTTTDGDITLTAGGTDRDVEIVGDLWSVTGGAVTAEDLTTNGTFNLGVLDTFGVSDATPDVSAGSHFITNATQASITDFDGGAVGQLITVEQATATTFDCTASGLQCGSTDIVTATGDFTSWLYDGADWHMIAFNDDDTDLGTDDTGSGSLGSNLSSTTNDITSNNEAIVLAGTTESLTLTYTSNTATVTTATGVTVIDFMDSSIPVADLNTTVTATELNNLSGTNSGDNDEVGTVTDAQICQGDGTDVQCDITSWALAVPNFSDITVTATELEELATIGATVISAADWTEVAALDGLTEVRSMYWGAGAISASTGCTTAAEAAIVTSGPLVYTIPCDPAVDTDGLMYMNTVLPDGFDKTADVTFEISLQMTEDTGAGTAYMSVAVQCTEQDTIFDTTFGTAVAASHTYVAGDLVDELTQMTSAAVDTDTGGENCDAGELMFVKLSMCGDDATPTTGCTDNNTFENDFSILGVKMEYTTTIGD